MYIVNTFEEHIMQDIDAVSRINALKTFDLGGVGGPGGGSGVPVGGFRGKLIQSRVSFDTTEGTDYAVPSGPSLVTNLNRIRGGHALGDGSIIQRHVDSGVGTLTVSDTHSHRYPIQFIEFSNSVITDIGEKAIAIEIIPTTSYITISGYESFKWYVDGYLDSNSNGVGGIYHVPVDLTISNIVLHVNGAGLSSTTVDLETSSDGSTWSSLLTSSYPTLTSGQVLSSTPFNVSLSSGVVLRSRIVTAGSNAKNLTIIATTRENITASLVSELPDKTGQSGKFLGVSVGGALEWQTPVGQVSSVFGRTGDVTSVSGDYDHNQLANAGTYSHTDLDAHLNNTVIHIPDTAGLIGAVLVNLGSSTAWSIPSGFGHTVQHEGVDVTVRTKLNFTGSVELTDDGVNDATIINILGGGTADLATVPESNAGVIDNKAVTPAGLPLRVENEALIHNQAYGGNARGQGSVDLQSLRDNPTEVASGNRSSIVAGGRNTVEGSYSAIVAGNQNLITDNMLETFSFIGAGENNIVDAGSSFIGAGSYNQVDSGADESVIIGGNSNRTSSRLSSVVGGMGARTSQFAQVAHSSGSFALPGDAQGTIQCVLRREIDHSSLTGFQTLYLDGASEMLTMPDNTVWAFEILLVGATAGLNNFGSYKIVGTAHCSGSIVSVDYFDVSTLNQTSAWSVEVNSDATHLLINVSDTTDSDIIRWVATLRSSEVTF